MQSAKGKVVAMADRLHELLAAEATELRLDEADHQELRALLGALPPQQRRRERDAMHEAATLAQAAFLAEDRAGHRRMPEELRARLSGMGRARAVDTPPRRVNRSARWGWAAATAMGLAWLVSSVLLERPPILPEPAMVQSAPDALALPWRSEITAYEQVRGEIIWSDSLQAGEMRFAGLPLNDPDDQQYQLWIVDPDRYANPVDGGVFNASASGEAVIRVDAKLPVDAPVAFAVTLEQAGGVVVSDGPLLLVAATGSRPEHPL